MKEKKLIKLGFTRHDVTAEESGSDAYHYYTYDLSTTNYQVALMADNDENIDNWTITFFEAPEIKFTNYNDIKKLIKIFKNAKSN